MVRSGSEVLCGERKPARKPIHRASPAFDALCANDHLDCQGRSALFGFCEVYVFKMRLH
jgi:hypothetical protein